MSWFTLGWYANRNDDPDFDCGIPFWRYLFVAGYPFLMFTVGDGDVEGMFGRTEYHLCPTFVPARMVNRRKRKNFPRVPHPRFVRGANGWNWARMTDLASVLGLDPATLWKQYYHIAIGAEWLSCSTHKYGFVVCEGESPSNSRETMKVMLWDEAPAPFAMGYILQEAEELCYTDPGLDLDDAEQKVASNFSVVDWSQIWVPAVWAMRVCYLHHFVFQPE